MSANNAFFKPSLSINDLVSQDIQVDSERFLLFLKAYYEWLQTATITITNKAGTFVRDEIITGDTSGASAIIKEVKSASIVVRMQTQRPFDVYETITGDTSAATATISSIVDNVVRKTGQLLNYRDATKTVDKYVEFLQNELYASFPRDSVVDKRFIARKYKDYLQNKGNEESYKFLFRMIYDEEIEIKYPGEDILRVSDGNFEKTQIIRAVIEDEETIFDYLNQTIKGQTSDALGNVVDIKLTNVGTVRVAEMTLKLVSGTFDAAERIEIVGTETTNTEIYGMVTGFTINDAGSGYSVGDAVTITSNTGQQAVATVSSIKASPITAIKVNVPGYGYRLNTNATITNTGTGGSGLVVRVTEIANTYTVGGYTVGETATISIVGRGSGYFSAPTITLTDTTISSLGLLSENLITIANTGNNYAVGDTLVFTGGAGSNAAGQIASVNETTTYDLLFEDGFRMKADGSYYDIIKNEDWSVTGGITRLELTNFGTGYTSANLPSISVTTGTGSGANLVATGIQGAGANVTVDVANNSAGIGSIRKIVLKNFGVGYESANVNLTSVGDGNANVTAVVSGLGVSDGTWIDDDGKIDYKVLQDSYYYQDFSYVIKSALQYNEYASIVKEIIHPAGLQFFGEILVVSNINVAANFTSVIETLQNITQYIYYFESQFSVATSPAVSTYKTIVRQILADAEGGLFGGAIVPYYYGDETLNLYSGFTISSYANTTFDTYIGDIQLNVPVQLNITIPKTFVVPSVSATSFSMNEMTRHIELNSNLESSLSSYFECDVIGSANSATSPMDANVTTFSNALISSFKNLAISSYANNAFLDEYFSNIKLYTKIIGTVSVSGNQVTGYSTSFNTDYSVGSDLIVGSQEKFIVSSISNNTFLTLNVPAESSYANVTAYK